jgi:hypothetical protein
VLGAVLMGSQYQLQSDRCNYFRMVKEKFTNPRKKEGYDLFVDDQDLYEELIAD